MESNVVMENDKLIIQTIAFYGWIDFNVCQQMNYITHPDIQRVNIVINGQLEQYISIGSIYNVSQERDGMTILSALTGKHLLEMVAKGMEVESQCLLQRDGIPPPKFYVMNLR